MGHRKKASESNAAWVVLLTFLGGVAGMVGVFVDVFWDFDPEVFVFYFPLFGLYLYLLRWA